jgi:endonuclease III
MDENNDFVIKNIKKLIEKTEDKTTKQKLNELFEKYKTIQHTLKWHIK